MKDPETELPFSAVMGHAGLKKFLTITVVEPGMGIILLKGPVNTMKGRFVRSMCSLARSLKQYEDDTSISLRSFDGGDLYRKVDRITNNYDTEYIVLPSCETFDIAEVEDVIDYWKENDIQGKSLILLWDEIPDHPAPSVEADFRIDVSPVDDIEHRIEMVKREREYFRDKRGFQERFKVEEKRLIARIANARKALEKVNLSEALAEELRGELRNIFEDRDITRPYRCAYGYACAEAAYNDRRWISREDLEYALGYLNR